MFSLDSYHKVSPQLRQRESGISGSSMTQDYSVPAKPGDTFTPSAPLITPILVPNPAHRMENSVEVPQRVKNRATL